jgi:hypothetical protein
MKSASTGILSAVVRPAFAMATHEGLSDDVQVSLEDIAVEPTQRNALCHIGFWIASERGHLDVAKCILSACQID